MRLNVASFKVSTMARISMLLIVVFSISACSWLGLGKKGGSEGTDGLSEAALNAERDRRFGEGGIPMAERGDGVFRSVPFEFDSSNLDSAGRQSVEFNAEILNQNPEVRVTLEGHCDERGTAEYNMALGERRARAVKDLLQSLGVSSSRLEIVSYGEEVPVDPAHDESAWAQNRRVHFSGFRDLPQR